VERAKERVKSGIQAHTALQALRADHTNQDAHARFDAHRADLGYGLLLLRYTRNPATATPELPLACCENRKMAPARDSR
jgi:cytochrome d ubiquinol oxidase subunit I